MVGLQVGFWHGPSRSAHLFFRYAGGLAAYGDLSAPQGFDARKKTTSLRVVFPAAVSGIVAALIIATSRAIGETMVVAVAAGAPQARTVNPLDPGGTMTSAMVQLATGSDQVTGNTAAFQSLFFIGLLLFIVTFLLNIVGDAFVRRTRQSY